jgi:hypothetical protein
MLARLLALAVKIRTCGVPDSDRNVRPHQAERPQ